MNKRPYILIIGAGLIGLSCADSLMARGAQVTLIERENGPGLGASFSNSGMIHPSQAYPWLNGNFSGAAKAVLSLAEQSKQLLGERAKALDLKQCERPAGSVQLFDSIYFGQQAAGRYEELGISCERITGAPFTYERYALRFSGDASGNAYEYCAGLEASLRAAGANIVYGKTYGAFENEFDHIIIAAGTGSVALAKTYGIDLPVRPLRGHALNFAKPDIALPDIPIMHHLSRSALTIFGDHVRLSGTTGEDAPSALLEIWEEIAPEIIGALGDPISSWSEDRPMSELGRPIITQLKPGVWINAGHGHMGWTLSAGSGELMARMIMDGYIDNQFGLQG